MRAYEEVRSDPPSHPMGTPVAKSVMIGVTWHRFTAGHKRCMYLVGIRDAGRARSCG